MLRYLIATLIIILCLIPITSAIEPCPTCPVPTPHIVYVTVTVTIPVPQTLPPTPIPTPTPIPVPTQEPNVLTKFTGLSEYMVYGALFLLLIGGVIIMKLKQKKKPVSIDIQPEPPIKEVIKIEQKSNKYDDLYEDDPPKPEKIVEKPKKPKKPKSLLEQDFEF
jgi:hypothetical protein